MVIFLQEDSGNVFFDYWYLPAVMVLSLIIYLIKKSVKSKSTNAANAMNQKQNFSPVFNPVNTVNVNVNNSSADEITTKSSEIPRDVLIDSLKSKVNILFIDDDKKFNVVKLLKDSGYKNTTSVVDIKSLDVPLVRDANIYFIDINGVGKLMECDYEGLDLALMLKQRYPQKKVGIYSANKNFNAFHEAWDIVDFKLEKNALPYQFQLLVEQYTLELFS